MTTFAEGRERNIALGVWGAVGGFGAAAGVLLGGVLTDALSWEWIFFVNIPVGLAAFALAPVLLGESRDTRVKSFDALGAVLVTSHLTTLCSGSRRASSGAGPRADDRCLRALGGAARRLRRLGEPRRRAADGGILRTKTVLGANVAGFILGTALFSMFLMLTLLLRQVLGYSAMKTGVAYRGGRHVDHLGERRSGPGEQGRRPLADRGRDGAARGRDAPLHAGAGRRLVRVGPAARLPDHRARDGALLRADLDRGARRASAGRGRARVGPDQHVAAGRRRGRDRAPLGDRVTRTENEFASGTAVPEAMTSGFQLAFWVGTAIAVVGVVAALVLIRQEEVEVALEAALEAA